MKHSGGRRAVAIAIVLAGLGVWPARAVAAPVTPINPIDTVPLGYFRATATVTVAPHAVYLTVNDLHATANATVDSTVIPATSGTIDIYPSVLDSLTVGRMVFDGDSSSCVSGSPTLPDCSPRSPGRSWNARYDAPATLKATPGGTTSMTCAVLPLHSAEGGAAFPGDTTWAIRFNCENPAYGAGLCEWYLYAVARPTRLAEVATQTYSLNGTAGEVCSRGFT
jgi:hypothetical protein